MGTFRPYESGLSSEAASTGSTKHGTKTELVVTWTTVTVTPSDAAEEAWRGRMAGKKEKDDHLKLVVSGVIAFAAVVSTASL